MRIDCPYCGSRDSSEFHYYGDASRVRPALSDNDVERWYSYVYERDNPKGPHQEFWMHLHGCRQWLVVERDTFTHEIHKVTKARERALEQLAARGGKP